MTMRIAVLASGGGSNLQAILDHFGSGEASRAGEVALVASDRADAGALDRARTHDVRAVFMDRELRTSGLAPLLAAHDIELVVLAGYLRFVPADVTRTYRGHIVNVHPALLPAFGGAGMWGHHVHEAVVARGARVTGATVHFVDEEYDHGPIIAQWPVPVWPNDTPSSVAARVLEVEHQLYPRVVQRMCDGSISLGADGIVRGTLPIPIVEHFILAGPADDFASHIRAVVP